MQSERPPDQMQHSTPMPPRAGSPEIPMPYLLFGTCTALLLLGLFMAFVMDNSRSWAGLGVVIAIPSGIGALVLPIVSQMRLK